MNRELTATQKSKIKAYLTLTTEMIFLLGGYKYLVNLQFVLYFNRFVDLIVAECVVIMLATGVFSSATSK
jgi:hypothetical protein